MESSATTVATVLENVDTVGTLVSNVWTIMTANPVLLVFICVSLIGVGFKVFRLAKRAARG